MSFVKRNLTDNPPSPCCEWNVQLQEIELEVKVKSIAYLECHQEVCPTNRQCHVHLGNLLVKVSNQKNVSVLRFTSGFSMFNFNNKFFKNLQNYVH